MLKVSQDLLKLIISIRSNVDYGLWNAFIRELKSVNQIVMDESLHFIPDPSDYNAGTRCDVLRGIAICADIFTHIFEAPEESLEQSVNINEIQSSSIV